MENVFLVLDNLLVLVNDYLYGYWEYLKGLMSLFIIYIGLGDELISDDGFDECKCFFQRIWFELVKFMFLFENEILQYIDFGMFLESFDNCKLLIVYIY